METDLPNTTRRIVEQLVQAGDFTSIDAAVRRLSLRAVHDGVLINVILRSQSPHDIHLT